MRRSFVSSVSTSSIVSSNNNTTMMVNMFPASSSSRDVSLFSIITTTPAAAAAAVAAAARMGNIRTFATGSRGSRGYGWYHHYKNSTSNNNDSNNNSNNKNNNSKNRHLLGEYYDRPSLEYCRAWNTSILQLGSQQIYMDIVLEPRRNVVLVSNSSNSKMNTKNSTNPVVDENETIDATLSSLPSSTTTTKTTDKTTTLITSMSDKHNTKKFLMTPPTNTLTGEKHRIYIDIATTVCPTISQNFIDLLTRKSTTTTTTTTTNDSPNTVLGYRGTRFYRIEKNVGIYGGDIITNTGKMGCAANAYTNRNSSSSSSSSSSSNYHNYGSSATTISIQHPQMDPICSMYHIPGTITMIVPKVHEIDSRFLLCTQHAPHIDGICYPFGMISSNNDHNNNSLQLLQNWERNLLTLQGGIPSAYDLYIVKCGLVTTGKTETVTATKQQQQQQQQTI